jgi:hypothetical protein
MRRGQNDRLHARVCESRLDVARQLEAMLGCEQRCGVHFQAHAVDEAQLVALALDGSEDVPAPPAETYERRINHSCFSRFVIR